MRITNDDDKPSLDDALEHYGVKGMKWGVRRDRKALDRAAGRTPPKGKGRGPAIRDARRAATDTAVVRADAKKRRNVQAAKLNNLAREGASDAKFKKAAEEFKKADAEFQKARVAHRDNPQRAAAARVTYGEAAALMILTTPMVALPYMAVVTGYGRTVGRDQRSRLKNS